MVSACDKSRKALKLLSKASPDSDDFKRIIDDLVSDRNDRAVALVASSILEGALERALTSEFQVSSNTEANSLFAPQMPLCTFSAKIKLAYAIRICDKRETKNMNIIRDTRNAFAHSMKYLDFKTEEVAKLCSFIKTKQFKPVAETQKKISGGPRFLYISECLLLTSKLTNLALDENRLLAKLLMGNGA